MSGWDATGRLEAFWGKVGGRDKLADVTGIQRSTLSGYNTGRLPLGMKNAERIAAALNVTVFDLGAPTAQQAAARSVAVVDRVTAVEERLTGIEARLDEFQRALDGLPRPRGGAR